MVIRQGIIVEVKYDEEFVKRISKSTSNELVSRPGFAEKTADELENNTEFVSRIAKAVSVQEIQKSLSSLETRLSDVEQQLKIFKSAIAQQQRNIADTNGRQTH